MKKLLGVIIFLISVSFSFAQYPTPYQNIGSPTTAVRPGSGFIVPTMFMPPNFVDTAAANANSYTNQYSGSLIFTTSDSGYWARNPSLTQWVRVGTGGGGGSSLTDTVFVRYPLGVDTTTIPGRQIIFIRSPNGLVYGGVVTLDSCRRLNVTSAIYNLNYIQYSTLASTVTLALPDASLPRKDIIVVDTNALVSVITGMPAATPLTPYINPSSQWPLATIEVPAGVTCLNNVSVEIIYDEHLLVAGGEWDTDTSGTTDVDFDNPDNPYHLDTAAFVSTYRDQTRIVFTKAGAQDTVVQGEVFQMWPYLNGELLNQIQLQWYLNDTAVTNNIVVNSYMNILDSNEYQNVSIPMQDWTWSRNYFNKLVVSFAGDDTSGAKGLYLDYIRLIKGISNGGKRYVDSTRIIAGREYYYINGVAFDAGAVGGSGSGVEGVTGLNTDNTDPANPIVKISVDGTSITGQGTPDNPLVASTTGGTVTDVTGSAPIIITGTSTVTPNVTLDTSAGNNHAATQAFVINDRVNPIASNGISITGSYPDLTFKADTNVLATKNYVINDRVNIIAGTNITSITGTYPNLTINAATQGGGGGANNNIGSGYRWAAGGNDIKTFFAKNPLFIDSASNTNGLTVYADTSTNGTGLSTKYYANGAYRTMTAVGDSSVAWTDGRGRGDTLVLTAFDLWKRYFNNIYRDVGNVGIGEHSDTVHSKLGIFNSGLGTAPTFPNDSSGIMLVATDTATAGVSAPAITFKTYSWNSATSRAVPTRIRISATGTGTNVDFPAALTIGTSKDNGATYQTAATLTNSPSSGPILAISNSTYGNSAAIGSTLTVTGAATFNSGLTQSTSANAAAGTLSSNRVSFNLSSAISGAATGPNYIINFMVRGSINNTAGSNTTYTGILDSVTESGMTGTTHYALRTFRGHNLLNYGADNTGIGIAYPNVPSQKLDVLGNFRDSGYIILGAQYVAPATGATVTTTGTATIINPAGTIAALTINLPGSPVNGQTARYSFSQTVTTLTFANGTLANAITTIAAGTSINLIYSVSTGLWHTF